MRINITYLLLCKFKKTHLKCICNICQQILNNNNRLL